MSVLSKPYFHDEEAAFRYLESVVWEHEAICPHCGGVDRITKVKANPAKRIRFGLWRCGDCKKQFAVKVGTVFEHMRIPLHKALQAVYLVTSSKKGISAHQLHRSLEITYKSAWFLMHRIREAMRYGDLSPFGGNGGVVEVGESFIGRKKGAVKKRAFHHRTIHSNTVKGYFSIFKRDMKGVYQDCGEGHLHRYRAEFESRYNNRTALGCNDSDRMVHALGGIKGKRLMYRDSSWAR